MALKRYKNGTFEITSMKQAKEAYALMQELSDSILELEKEHGISEMRQDANNLKLSADSFLIKSAKDDIVIEDIGKRAKVIRVFDGQWIETKEDLRRISAPSGARSLRSIVGKDLWKKITKRTLDPEKLMEAVATGRINEDEIAVAYHQEPRKPYVRLYEDSDDEDD